MKLNILLKFKISNNPREVKVKKKFADFLKGMVIFYTFMSKIF